MFVTLAVEKVLRLSTFSALQPSNTPCIFVTLEVLNEFRSIVVSEVQFLNRMAISVTLPVSQSSAMNDFRLLQPSNMPVMIVTSLVLRLYDEKKVSLVMPANQ